MLSQLKHITLTIDRQATGRYGFDWMPRSLKSFENATACKLESVELIIRSGRDFATNMEEGDWRSVDNVLQQISRKFGSLRSLQVVCHVEKRAWASFPPSNPDPRWSHVEDFIRRRVDLSDRSNLYTVEVARVEDNVRRWVYVPSMGRISQF